MKQMNRILYLLIIGVVEVLFFAYTMMLYKRGTIDASDFQMGCTFMAMMALTGLALAFNDKLQFGKKREDGDESNLIEVSHTREGAIFEVLTGLILVGAWTVAIASDRFWIIEGFFSYLSPILMFSFTFFTITFLWIVYLPGFQLMMRKYTHVKPIALEVRMVRVLAVELALFVLLYVIPLEYTNTIFHLILAVIFFVTIVIFRYLIYKAK